MFYEEFKLPDMHSQMNASFLRKEEQTDKHLIPFSHPKIEFSVLSVRDVLIFKKNFLLELIACGTSYRKLQRRKEHDGVKKS